MSHYLVLHHILNFLHNRGSSQLFAGQYHTLCYSLDLHRCHSFSFADSLIGLGYCHDYFSDIENGFRAVSFYYFH